MEGDMGALYSLIEHPTTQRLLDHISGWASKRYKQDKDDVREALVAKLFNRVGTLKNPAYLKRWLYEAAKRHSLNQLRHSEVEKRYQEAVLAEHSKQFGTWHGEPLAHPSAAHLPEDDPYGEGQQVAVRDMIRRAALRAIRSFPEPVAEAWAAGTTAREISEETGLSVVTVYRLLSKMERAVVAESLSEIESIMGQMESAQSDIENEKVITRGILEVLRSK
jgi:RNA polymerase sigma factor (sigma-70 family)